MQDLHPIFIPPGAVHSQNKYWDDPDSTILDNVLRHVNIGKNQIVSNHNTRINESWGCKNMAAELQDRVAKSGGSMVVLVYHGEGYEIREPGGQYPSHPLQAKSFNSAMEVKSCIHFPFDVDEDKCHSIAGLDVIQTSIAFLAGIATIFPDKSSLTWLASTCCMHRKIVRSQLSRIRYVSGPGLACMLLLFCTIQS